MEQVNPETQQTTLFTKEPYIEDAGPRKVGSIKFSLSSEAEICKGAEVQIWKAAYYDQSKKPIESGLLDSRMGPPNKNGICATCHGDFTKCPGHYGYLPLNLPVYNVGYLNIIANILKCICKSCSRILLAEIPRKDYLRRMRTQKIAQKKTDMQKVIIKTCNTPGLKNCSRCGYVNGIVKKATGMLGIIHDRSKIADKSVEECRAAVSHIKEQSRGSVNMVYMLTPAKVLSLFKKMLDEDCEVLYLADRPEKLIITSIAVPPTVIRPSVLVGGTRSNENDITERLKRIIQANARVRTMLDGTNRSQTDWEYLQIEVAQYINSAEKGVPAHMQAPRPLSGFVQRLKGKQGRFRQNLSAKRVEFTGRTVISPDPNLKITEVGIPILMAQTLTFPERVTSHNIEKLRQCVRNGSNKYPGAKFLAFPDGSKVSLMFPGRKRYADELKIGYIVDRHLEDGDVVLFNRQPSLHRMSIMSHRAKIMPWRTLRFNESVCNPYNADFDGDEMNMHVPQTEDARTEALTLMGVQNNLCTPKNGEILVASTQDFLTSSFLITRKDTFYDRAAFSLMCSYMGDGMDHVDLPTPTIFKPIELWTGKQLFSVLVRPNASLRVYVNLTVTEKTFTKSWKREKTMCPNDGFVYFRNSELISGQLGKATLGNGDKNGLFSILLRDYNAHAAASCMNRLAKLSARWIGNHGFSIGIDDVQPGESLSCQKTDKINEGYSKCDEFIKAYSDGKLELLGGCDAAQTLEVRITGQLNTIRETTGDVCMAELHWRNSPLIMSQCGSKGSPINISQMIACVGQQSVGGRRAPNGFIDRSLPHFPRNSKTPAAKGFVANSFYSGLTATEFFFHTMGGREGLVDTAVKTADTGYMARRLMKALEDLSIQYDDTVRNANGGIVQFRYGDDGLDPAQMEGKDGVPLNFDRVFMKVKATCPPVRDHPFLSPEDIKQAMDKRFSERDATPEGGCSVAFIESLSKFMGFEKGTFSEKAAQNISGVTSKQLQVFLNTCISRYHSKRIEAGTAIGAIGAQSIAEPGTQMTLKTFHFAGVASKNVTLGFPRVKEIVGGAKTISRPAITAPLECDDNEKAAQIVKGRIEKTVLGQVAKSIKIVMTQRSGSVVVTLDLKRIEASQLCIDANVVKDAILQIPRIKSKQLNIKVLDVKKLEIIPQVDRSKLHFELSTLKNVLPKTVVKGISTIERVLYQKEKVKGKNREGYQLFVEGTGLLAVMGTEGVDGLNTKSNFVKEMQDTLGIEAARKCIIDEIGDVMDKSGMSIDIRHMMLLADVMTFTGDALGINIFGLTKMKESVLMLASFEKTEYHLFNASVNGREDNIEGVSECIIMGTPIQIGTGILKVKQSVEHVHKLNYAVDPTSSGEEVLKLNYGANPLFF